MTRTQQILKRLAFHMFLLDVNFTLT